MRDVQVLTVALATVPTMLTVLSGILINNARLGDLKSEMSNRIGDVNTRIGDVNVRLAEMRAEMVTKAELRRMEEVIDARLRHLEER